MEFHNPHYIKDNIIFSNKNLLLSYININFNEELLVSPSNVDLLNSLNEIIDNKKTLEINGLIDNIEGFNNKIELKSYKLIKINNDDYKFIGKTSSLFILDQIINEKENNENILKFKKNIESYLKKQKTIEKEKVDTINYEIKKNKKSFEKINNNIIKYESDYLDENVKEIEIKSKEIYSMNQKIIELNKLIDELSKKLDNNKNSTNEIKIKTNKLNDKLEDYNFEIKFIEEKIKILVNKKKLKSNKIIKPLSFILTLGIIYWTKYSDVNYIISKHLLKIANIKEKMLKIEIKLNKIEREESRKNEDLKHNEINITKQITISKEEIENLEEKSSKFEKDIDKLIKKNEPYHSKVDKLKIEREDIFEIIETLETTLKELELNSTQLIEEKISEIYKINIEDIKKIKELKNKLEKQKFHLNGDYILEII